MTKIKKQFLFVRCLIFGAWDLEFYYNRRWSWQNPKRCINARRSIAGVYTTRTAGTAGAKFPRGPGLKKPRIPGAARFAGPARNASGHWQARIQPWQKENKPLRFDRRAQPKPVRAVSGKQFQQVAWSRPAKLLGDCLPENG